MAVESIPDPVWYDNPDPIEVKDTTCAPPLPLLGAEEKTAECRRGMWVDSNFIFALHKDGSIYFWKSDIYGEWVVVELFLGLCCGAMLLFVPALIFILLPGIFRWFSNR